MSRLAALAVRSALAMAVVVGAGSAVVATAPPARAVAASDWQAGYIISDAQFYDGQAMTASQVQAFLASMYQGCAAGYTCMRDYRVTTPNRAPEAGLCQGYTGARNQTAAQIIAAVGASCGVSPKVLLVLIQKESGLLTSQTPSYTQVTGYGCPDSTGCDANYYGLFNQVYLAARQFKLYADYPNDYGYVAGRSNYVLYNPNTGCGGSNVYIVNQATAGLYDYTPYQPNAAALNNLGGTGNNCSAYGNRNFWYFFNSWFGPSRAGGSLLRSTAGPTVYLVDSGNKYPIDSMSTLRALPASFGGVYQIDQSYLDQLSTGPALGRFVRGEDGSVYLFDAATLHHVPTCAMVAAFGASCPEAVPLAAYEIAAFASGPDLSQVVDTPSAHRYLVTGGQRHEVLDDASLAAAGASATPVQLSDGAVGRLPLAAPIVRDGVAVQNRGDDSVELFVGGSLYPVAASVYATTPVATQYPVAGQLDPASLALLRSAAPLTGFATDGSSAYVITATGKQAVASFGGWGVTPSVWPASLLEALPTAGQVADPPLVKSGDSDATFVVGDGARYPVADWADARAISRSARPPVTTLLAAELAAIPAGSHRALTPGTLVKSANTPALYLVDGFTGRVHVQAMPTARALRVQDSYTVIDDATLNAYSLGPGAASPAISCSGADYLAYGGQLRPVAAADLAGYPLSFRVTDPLTCSRLAPVGAALSGPIYVRSSSAPTVYQIVAGERRPIMSPAALRSANDGTVPDVAWFADGQLDGITLGPPIR